MGTGAVTGAVTLVLWPEIPLRAPRGYPAVPPDEGQLMGVDPQDITTVVTAHDPLPDGQHLVPRGDLPPPSSAKKESSRNSTRIAEFREMIT